MIQGPSPELLTIALLALSAADVATTVRGLRRGGTEAMPLGRALFARFGVLQGALVAKAIGLPIILWVIWRHPEAWYGPLAVIFLMVGLVASNLFNTADS